MNTLTDYDQGWVVGMLEGEGTFYARGNPDCPIELRVECTSIDIETPNRLQELLGGNIYGPYRRNEVKWALYKRKAVLELIVWLRPLLCDRRQVQIDKMLKEFELRTRV